MLSFNKMFITQIKADDILSFLTGMTGVTDLPVNTIIICYATI